MSVRVTEEDSFPWRKAESTIPRVWGLGLSRKGKRRRPGKCAITTSMHPDLLRCRVPNACSRCYGVTYYHAFPGLMCLYSTKTQIKTKLSSPKALLLTYAFTAM